MATLGSVDAETLPAVEELETVGSGGSTTSAMVRVGAGAAAGGIPDPPPETDCSMAPGSFANILMYEALIQK